MAATGRELLVKSLVFHIGLPKTGSSALQIFLANNYEKLAKQSVDYFQIGEFPLGVQQKISAGNGAHIAGCVLPMQTRQFAPEREARLKALFKTIRESRCDTGLLSSEQFADAKPELFRALLEHIRKLGVTPKVFYFIRNQEDLLTSSYIQVIKRHRYKRTIEQFIRETYKTQVFLKFDTYYNYMSDLFGAEHVSCRVYDEINTDTGNLYRAFLEMLGVIGNGMVYDDKRVNSAIRASDIALLRIVNRYAPRMQFSDMIVDNVVALGQDVPTDANSLMPPDLIAEVRAYFQDENTRMAQRYFKRDVLFEPRPLQSPVAVPTLATLSRAEVVEFFCGVLARMDERIAALSDQVARLEERK
jgi:hypothetical protein